jgi:hypothetical protein
MAFLNQTLHMLVGLWMFLCTVGYIKLVLSPSNGTSKPTNVILLHKMFYGRVYNHEIKVCCYSVNLWQICHKIKGRGANGNISIYTSFTLRY